MSPRSKPTLAKLILGPKMMTLMFFIALLTIFGLLFLLWLEFTNPELLESASAHGSSRQLQDLQESTANLSIQSPYSTFNGTKNTPCRQKTSEGP